MDDVIIGKVATIERCIKRINEEAQFDWKGDYTHQDALLLNLERACQASIDLAAHIVRTRKFGIPKESREVFDQLLENEVIEQGLAEELKKMVGFRNIAVHDYASLNLEVVETIIQKKLSQFESFTQVILKYSKDL